MSENAPRRREEPQPVAREQAHWQPPAEGQASGPQTQDQHGADGKRHARLGPRKARRHPEQRLHVECPSDQGARTRRNGQAARDTGHVGGLEE